MAFGIDDGESGPGSRTSRLPDGPEPYDAGDAARPVAADFEQVADDVEQVTSAVLTASRLLVAVSARSLAAVNERITLPQFRTLVILASTGDTKLVALARRLAVNPSTAMRMVDRLASAGLVRRGTNPADRRETILTLTPEGRHIVDDITARRRQEIAEIVARMPPHHRIGLVSALQAFSDAGGEAHADLDPRNDADLLGWD